MPPRTEAQAVDRMVDADIEFWMEQRENEGYKWGEQLGLIEEEQCN